MAKLDVPGPFRLDWRLSFLGLGIQPRRPGLGGMGSEGRVYLEQAWWAVVFPGLAILLTTGRVNRIGDWLRGRLDPSLRVAA